MAAKLDFPGKSFQHRLISGLINSLRRHQNIFRTLTRFDIMVQSQTRTKGGLSRIYKTLMGFRETEDSSKVYWERDLVTSISGSDWERIRRLGYEISSNRANR